LKRGQLVAWREPVSSAKKTSFPPWSATMLHNPNAARRRRIPRPKRRVFNWPECDAALHRRGNLIAWFTDEAIAHWKAAPRTTPDGRPAYSELAITMAFMLRAAFHLVLRQTEGLIASILPRPIGRATSSVGGQHRAEAGRALSR